MSDSLVTYERRGNVGHIRMNDGRVNAISPSMIDALHGALTRAETDGVVIVLSGREGVFSAGFDLKVLKKGGPDAFKMIIGGFKLAARILEHPYPVVAASAGHAMAMGAFLMLSADHRLGVAGDFTYAANEVAIGLTMPHAAVAILRQRLAPAHFERATLLSERYSPEGAVTAGFLDRVVAPEELDEEAARLAESLTELDRVAHRRTKSRARRGTMRAVRVGILRDTAELSWMGVRAMMGRK